MPGLPYIDVGPTIEAYSTSVRPTQCTRTVVPGTKALGDLLVKTFGGRYEVLRDCARQPMSDHHEGRALDWFQDANVPSQRANVDRFMAWLLDTDRYGNRHANARRAGLRYMIWNGRIWSSGSRQWKQYMGSSPHRDHVHISLDWPGARGETSLYKYLRGELEPRVSPWKVLAGFTAGAAAGYFGVRQIRRFV